MGDLHPGCMCVTCASVSLGAGRTVKKYGRQREYLVPQSPIVYNKDVPLLFVLLEVVCCMVYATGKTKT